MAQPDGTPPGPQETLATALRRSTRLLADAGVEGAGRDARLLLTTATGLAAGDLITRADHLVGAEAAARFAEMLARRCRREPVSRILGAREFYGRPFLVTPGTLDPRADSETVIEAVLALAGDQGWRDRPVRILDVGTGTGCLLLTLLAEFPQATGIGTDISEAALAVAGSNARSLGLDGRAAFRRQRSLQDACDTFDILVSNPPYIPSHVLGALDPEVRAYDPHAALDGGPDGLAVYREIAGRLTAIVPAGWAFFEVGAGQAEAVLALLSQAMPAIDHPRRVWRDLGGHMRCVAIRTLG